MNVILNGRADDYLFRWRDAVQSTDVRPVLWSAEGEQWRLDFNDISEVRFRDGRVEEVNGPLEEHGRASLWAVVISSDDLKVDLFIEVYIEGLPGTTAAKVSAVVDSVAELLRDGILEARLEVRRVAPHLGFAVPRPRRLWHDVGEVLRMSDERAEPEVRLATIEDAPEMLRVIEAAFDRWPVPDIDVTPLEHLRWKMTPPGLTPAHTVALLDGRMVAVGVRWTSVVQVGGEQLISESGIDQAVLPEMQGRGLGGAITRLQFEASRSHTDMAFASSSNNPLTPLIWAGLDPTAVEYRTPVWSRAFGLRAFVRSQLRGGGMARLGRSLLSEAARRLRRRRPPLSGARIEVLTQFDSRAEDLWEAFASHLDMAIVRSVDYLNWRYCDPRGGTTLVLAAVEGDRLLGYAVFKRQDDWSNVLDLVTHPDHPEVIDELLEAGCQRMGEAGARGANCWLSPGHPAERALKWSGFLKAPWLITLGFGPQRRGRTSPALDRLYAGTARGHLVSGDADFI